MQAPALDVLACLSPAWLPSAGSGLRIAVLACLVALMSWVAAQPRFPGRRSFLALHGAMGLWLLSTAVEHAASGLHCKAALALAAWPAILAIPLLWAMFLRQVVDRGRPHIGQWLGFGAVLLAMSVLALSNGEHGLLYPSATAAIADESGLQVVRFARGPLFLLALAWGYGLLLSSSLRLLRAWREARGVERGHWLGLLVISVMPWATNLAYVVFDLRLFGSDPTPISFAVAAAGFAWLIHARRLFEVVPVARQWLFTELPDPVLILDAAGRVMEANAAAQRLVGAGSSPGAGLPLGRPLTSWGAFGAQLGARLAEPDAGMLMSFTGHSPIYELRVHPVGQASRQIGCLVQLHDVTEQQRAQTRMVQTLAERNSQLGEVAALQDELREQALRDPLTGLHNRRALGQRFAQEAEYHGTTGQPMALVLIDLDHFKRINDSRGHAAGDAVLCDFSALLRAGLRSGDSVFRIGGEEFALLLPGADAQHAASRVEALRESLRLLPPVAARSPITFSAGVAAFGDAGTTLDTMLHAADMALDQARADGRDRTRLAAAPA